MSVHRAPTVYRSVLTSPSLQLSQRILASYILYALYAPHPISINPFRSALLNTFNKEKEFAAKAGREDVIGQNEQLVWVLWKILKGDGSDVRPLLSIVRTKASAACRATVRQRDQTARCSSTLLTAATSSARGRIRVEEEHNCSCAAEVVRY